MGHLVHPNSVRNHQKELATKNKGEVGKAIKTALQVKVTLCLFNKPFPMWKQIVDQKYTKQVNGEQQMLHFHSVAN